MDGSMVQLVLLAFNCLLGVAAWAIKTNLSDLKSEIKTNRLDIEHVKDKYFKREDFTEFKQELWLRLDRFEQDVKAQLNSK